MAALGHEERFPPTRLSAGCEFRKETIGGIRRNGRDAPKAVVPLKAISLSGLPKPRSKPEAHSPEPEVPSARS
jgi:hypothetical protein